MSYNKRSPRRRYSAKDYKNLHIADKDEIEQKKKANIERLDNARNSIMESGGYVDGYLQAQDRKRKTARRKKTMSSGIKVGLIALSLVLVIITVVSLIPKNITPKYTQGFEVLLNGTVLGVTSNAEPVSNALDDIREEFRNDYNMNVFDDTTLEYRPVMIEKQFICPPDYFVGILKDCVDVKVKAWVILVNNSPAAAVKTKEEAQTALDRVLEPFAENLEENEQGDLWFVEDVQIKEMPIEYSQVSDGEFAYKLLRFGGDIEERRHTVVRGETLYGISKEYDISLADIRKANPKLAVTSKIYPGDVLLIAEVENRVNIKFTKTVDREETLPYETIYVEDDTMLVTERIVVQEGYDGWQYVNAKITYINGVEADIDYISEPQILTPKIDKIVRKGTKEVPRIQQLAAEGDMPIPLKSGTYRISCRFGPRNLDIPGASKWHKGIDLAANKGTPIYASMPGTVTHSGSGTGYGLYIKIDHGNGVETRYGHCSELIVQKGDKVEQGEIIGLVGNTGVSSGSHLHFEVRINGKAYDPLGEYDGAAP